MPNISTEQPRVATEDAGIDGLLTAHRAISNAWYSNWRAEQQARLQRLLDARLSDQVVDVSPR